MKTSMQQLQMLIPGPVTDQWPLGLPFAAGLSHGSMSVELFAPRGTDSQTPHRQDELYFIVQGTGEIEIDGERHACSSGDAFFVAAGMPHRFENFSDDFVTWVVFWGPQGGEK